MRHGLRVSTPGCDVIRMNHPEQGQHPAEVDHTYDVEQVNPVAHDRSDQDDYSNRDPGGCSPIYVPHPDPEEERQPGCKAPDEIGHQRTPSTRIRVELVSRSTPQVRTKSGLTGGGHNRL